MTDAASASGDAAWPVVELGVRRSAEAAGQSLKEAECAGTVAAITSTGGTAAAFAADVDDETAVATAVTRITAELGAPTVLINNAGIGGPNLGVEETSTQQWDAVTGVSLRGAFFFTRAVTPSMTAAGRGRIVNMSSISALGDAGRVDYASAKAGLIGFTKSLALQLARYGVTANAIAPGIEVSLPGSGLPDRWTEVDRRPTVGTPGRIPDRPPDHGPVRGASYYQFAFFDGH